MANTEYKTYSPTKKIGLPTISPVTSPAPLQAAPYVAALRPPGVLAAARRIILSQQMGGGDTFAIPSTTPAGVPDYPETTDTYEAIRMTAHVTAGNYLEARVIAAPSGACEEQNGVGAWLYAGASGAVRFEAIWNTGADEDTPDDVSAPISASDLEYNIEWTGVGGLWSQLRFAYVESIAPTTYPLGLASAQVLHTEWVPVELAIHHEASARVVHVAISEVARVWVGAHDSDEATTHAWPEWIALSEEYPQESAPDGATYEERRFGVHRSLIAARRQADRMGPAIWTWSPHDESTRDVTVDARASPVTITSATYVWIHDSSVTAYDADRPGFAVSGAYAQRYRDCDPGLVLLDNAAAIPVRLRVWANFSGAGANTLSIKVQVSARSSLTLTIAQSVTLAEYTITGYLESDRTGDDVFTSGMVFAKTTGGTAQIYAIGLEFSEMAST